MKKILLFLAFCFIYSNINAQQILFSDSVQISLITCAPGEEVYAKFGHTGLRVNDLSKGLDLVFNYGIFSFNTKNFYLKFIKGETDYLLGVQLTSDFLTEYKERNSMVWEQILNLSLSEKRKIINDLLINYEPQNRVYRYNFIFDNCATRPRDKIISGLEGQILYSKHLNIITYRQWVGRYVGEDSWLKFGIDLIFGMDADKNCKPFQSMFLPEVLMAEFQNANVAQADTSKTKKLVASNNILVQASVKSTKESSIQNQPLFFTLLLLFFGIVISFIEIKRHKYFKIFDSILLIITGFVGVVAFYLMFISIHPMVKNNLNLLWLNPLNLIAAILIWIKGQKRLMNTYMIINLAFIVIVFLGIAFSLQWLNLAFIPLIILLLLRYTMWILDYNKKLIRRNI